MNFLISHYLFVGVQNIPVLSGLHSGADIGKTINSLHKEASKIKWKRFQQFTTGGLENDEVRDSLEKLLELKECYEDNYI